MVSFPKALAAGIAIGVVEAVIKYNTPNQPGVFDGLLFVVVLDHDVSDLAQRGDRDERRIVLVRGAEQADTGAAALEVVGDACCRVSSACLALIAAIAVPLVVTEPSRHFLYANVLLFALIASVARRVDRLVRAGLAGPGRVRRDRGARVRRAGERQPDRSRLRHAPHRGRPAEVSARARADRDDRSLRAHRGRDRRGGAARPRPAPRHRDVHVRARRAAVHLPVAVPVGRRRWRRIRVRATAEDRLDRLHEPARVLLRGTGGARARHDPRRAAASFRHRPGDDRRARQRGLGRGLHGVAGTHEADVVRVGRGDRRVRRSIARPAVLDDQHRRGVHRQRLPPARRGRRHRGRRLGRGTDSRRALGCRASRVLAFEPLVPLFTSSIGLLLLLMFCPGGLVQVGYMIRDALFAWIDRRLPEPSEAAGTEADRNASGSRRTRRCRGRRSATCSRPSV